VLSVHELNELIFFSGFKSKNEGYRGMLVACI